ncbi:MAG: glycine cleavage system protein H, partial [Bacteroidetes bacterium]|nr:glycine cleavage system protein H [Bacteroidota bacterium]
KDPYNEGWLIKISITNPAELNALLDVQTYRSMIGK